MITSVLFSAILSLAVCFFYVDDLVHLLNIESSQIYVQSALWLAMFFIVINEQDILLSFALKGLDLYKKIVLVELVTRSIWLLVAFIIAWSQINHALEWIVFNYACINVIRVIIKYTFFVQKGWVGSVKIEGVSEQLLIVIKDGVSCLFLHIGGILAIVLDRLIFNHLFGLATFSAYFLAMQLFQSIHGLTNTIFVSFLNHYALKKNHAMNHRQLLFETTLCVAIYSSLSAVALTFIAWAYPQYAGYVKNIFLPLSLAFMVLTLSIPANNILILWDKMNWVGLVSLLAGLLTCSSSWFFFSADVSEFAYAKNIFGLVQMVFNLTLLMYLIHVRQHHPSH
jgi:hypothetical protein